MRRIRQSLLVMVAIVICTLAFGIDAKAEDNYVTLNNMDKAGFDYDPSEGYTLPIPTRTGFTFIGWTGDNGDVPQISVVVPPNTAYGPKTYYAHWRGAAFKINYDLQGGTLDQETLNKTLYAGDILTTVKPEPKKVGYKFLGWEVTYYCGSDQNAYKTTSQGVCTFKGQEYMYGIVYKIDLKARWQKGVVTIGGTDGYTKDGEQAEEFIQLKKSGAKARIRNVYLVYEFGTGTDACGNSYTYPHDYEKIPKSCYDVTYTNNKKLDGIATVTLTFKGEYSGLAPATFKFEVRLDGEYGVKNEQKAKLCYRITKEKNGYEATCRGYYGYPGEKNAGAYTDKLIIPDYITVLGVKVPVTAVENSESGDYDSSTGYYEGSIGFRYLYEITIPETVKTFDCKNWQAWPTVIILKGNTKIIGELPKYFKVKNAKLEAKFANKTFTNKGLKYKVTDATLGEVSLISTTYSEASTKLTKLTIPKTVSYKGTKFKVVSIDNKVFKNYTNIKTLTIGDNIRTIGKEAFSGCTNLTTVNMGTSVKKINNKAFYNCKKLKTVKIKSTVLKKVGKQAFKNINKKAKIQIPASNYKAYKKLFNKTTGFKSTMKIVKKK